MAARSYRSRQVPDAHAAGTPLQGVALAEAGFVASGSADPVHRGPSGWGVTGVMLPVRPVGTRILVHKRTADPQMPRRQSSREFWSLTSRRCASPPAAVT